MSLTPQLRPTDFEKIDSLSDRGEREQAYADNAIYQHEEPQGLRYTKGTSQVATKRSWQSLDTILRSDASSSAALPAREMRIARVFTALTVVAGILTVAGTSASAREGLDLKELNGPGAIMLAGGLATVGFGITSGVFFGKTKRGYQKAIDVYNDSLAIRLGLNNADGDYIPPKGVLVDKDGYVVLDERERGLDEDPNALPQESTDATEAEATVDVEEPPAPEPVDEAVAAEPTAPEGAEPAPEPVAAEPVEVEEAEVAPPPAVVPTPGGSAAAPSTEGAALELRPR